MNILITILILTIFALGIWVWRLRWEIKRLETEKAEREEQAEELGGLEKKGLERVNQKRSEAKEKGKERILEHLKTNNRITNDEVEKMLSVSDATATRYLEELESEGKLRQIGTVGPKVSYELI